MMDFTQPVGESDHEVNEQVIPARAWDNLLRDYRAVKTASMHRGHLSDQFFGYLNGVADGLELDREDLLDRVKEVTGL